MTKKGKVGVTTVDAPIRMTKEEALRDMAITGDGWQTKGKAKPKDRVILCVWCWWNKVVHCECAKQRKTSCKDYREADRDG